mmetsp:Transcript_54902/g.163344  ORF Transcript_54902/g.163344 Transcript_54902/m.163344 type:complete len:149 (+) Transcript_54902:44-490(+)
MSFAFPALQATALSSSTMSFAFPEVPTARVRERRPTANARDDSCDSDQEQPAAVATASYTRRTQASAPPAQIRKDICEHGRRSSRCNECGGSGRCKHGRLQYVCKECGGKGICEHGCRRSICKQSGGRSICEHGRERRQCKECGGVRR